MAKGLTRNMSNQKDMGKKAEAKLDTELDTELDTDLDTDLDTELDTEMNMDTALQDPDLELDASLEATPAPAMDPAAAQTHLLKLGRGQGFITYDDVLRVMPEAENNMDQLEDLFSALFEQGIEVACIG